MSGFASKRSATTASRSGSIEPGPEVEQTFLPAQGMGPWWRPGEGGVASGNAAVASGIVEGALPQRPSGASEAGNGAVPSGIVALPAPAPMHPAPWGEASTSASGSSTRQDRTPGRGRPSILQDDYATGELRRMLTEMRLGDASRSRGSGAAELTAEDRRRLAELDDLRKAGDNLHALGEFESVAGIRSLMPWAIDKLGVRRGEPGADEKRRLIEEEGNLPRETLAMIDHFAISRAELEAQRRERGLKDRRATAQFAHEMRPVRGMWSGMSSAQRADAIGRRINARLRDIGVPALKVKAMPMSESDSGRFHFRDWSIAINERTLAAPQIDSDQLGTLTNTAYHEARHAEQWYLMARWAVEQGRSSDTVAKDTRMPLAICEAAAHEPPLSHAQADVAQVYFRSVYGERAHRRDHNLNELTLLDRVLPKVRREYSVIAADPNRSPQDKAQKAEELHRLEGLYRKYHQAYKALPEEQDAWAVGAAAEQAYVAAVAPGPPRQ